MAEAHAFHGATAAPPQLPNTVKAIRGALPADLRAAFQNELDDAVDLGDMNAVDDVKGRWWARAMWEYDPTIREDFAASARGELEFFPSPFAKR